MDPVDELLAELTDEQVMALAYDWRGTWARPDQLPPPGDWLVWLILSGRGWGKTRTGAEWIRDQASGERPVRIALVGRTAGDVRDVMVEGESGILAVSPPWDRPHYEPSKRRLTWANGSVATTFAATEPEQLRGPQFDVAWADEFCTWPYQTLAWDNLQFGLRLGEHPRTLITTTPKPQKLLKQIIADETTRITRGSSYDNRVNLSPAYYAKVIRRYEGTALGRQELEGQVLEEAPGALWKRERIDQLRVAQAPELVRIVVGVDPAASSGEDADENGIVVVGLGADRHLYVLADVSAQGKPADWGKRAVNAFRAWKADRIVAEANNGGEMVEHVIRTVDPDVPVKLVHASRGKLTRAEPISALHEQGREHHVGSFPELEDQKCTYVPGEKSPDRMDADVWASTELLGSEPVLVGLGEPVEQAEGRWSR